MPNFEMLDRQIEFVLPTPIAELNCRIVKMNSIFQIKLHSFCQIELPNQITKSIRSGKMVWQTNLPIRFGKPFRQI
jgi:hypothetical protein